MNEAAEQLDNAYTVAVVGGGTAGLALAAQLKRLSVGSVVVLEREQQAGGVPRHCGHYPFGIREYGRLLKGPEYASRNVRAAIESGVEIRTETSVTALHPGGRLSLSSPAGLQQLQAERIVLCTGVRESSRAQRLISGDRPIGVVSTGALQSLVYLKGMRPFKNPIILGSELVSFSAIETCRHLGIRPVAMVEELDRIVTHRIVQPYLAVRGLPLYLGASSLSIVGDAQVEALEFTDRHGKRKKLNTDGIIVSGRFRPEAALLRQSHLEVDPGSGGPVIDQFGQCSDPAYYSAGNLLRPAETSAWCWREGVATAKRIADELSGQNFKTGGELRLKVADPAIQFVVPQRLRVSGRQGGMDTMQLGLREPSGGILEAAVDGKCIWASSLKGRPVRRILKPLADELKSQTGTDIALTIRRGQ